MCAYSLCPIPDSQQCAKRGSCNHPFSSKHCSCLGVQCIYHVLLYIYLFRVFIMHWYFILYYVYWLGLTNYLVLLIIYFMIVLLLICILVLLIISIILLLCLLVLLHSPFVQFNLTRPTSSLQPKSHLHCQNRTKPANPICPPILAH